MSLPRFGAYELLEKIATGGMAEVFRARAARPGGLNKTVCLKRIHPSLSSDPSFVAMFIEEARLGLSLSHGNIVPVFDFGCIDGQHFIVMDHVEGRDLATVIARSRIVGRPFSAELAAYVVSEVLEGLAYAHESRDEDGRPLDLVHRDISPSNLMVSRAGELKILDFGIARSAFREFRTRTGVVKGKPGYMAPEQARGEAVDARGDIFACGVLLHELRTGRRPFSADDTGGGRLEIAVEEPLLASIVSRALAREPAERYGSAREMGEELGKVLAGAETRPTGAALAGWVEELFGAPASTPDWSLGDAVDRHLLAVLSAPSPEGDGPPTVPAGAPEGRREAQARDTERFETDAPVTEALAPPPSSPGSPENTAQERPARPDRAPEGRRARGILLGAAVLLVGGAAALGGVRALGTAPAPANSGPTEASAEAVAPARVEVTTRPAGAVVVVDGVAAEGRTPLELSVPPGRHSVEVRLAGHGTLRRSLVAGAGQLVAMDVVLSPSTAVLVVESDPPGASVRLDGAERGTTPARVTGLDREAVLELEVALEGRETWRERLPLDGRAEVTVRPVLVPLEPDPRPSGFLSVNAHPWAEVTLGGRLVGQTPVVRHRVPAGRHRVILRNEARGSSVVRFVDVRPGRETRLSVDLSAPP